MTTSSIQSQLLTIYSLYGVFKSLNEPGMDDYPIIYESPDPVQKKAFADQFKIHNDAMEAFKKEAVDKLLNFYV